MARRQTNMFNLSFLDLLTSALGAIIFLFVITPKGGEPAAKVQQAALYFDTTQMKIHGALADSLAGKTIGDTLFAILVDYKDYPKAIAEKPALFAFRNPEPKPIEKPKPNPAVAEKPAEVAPKPKPLAKPKPAEKPEEVEKPAEKPAAKPMPPKPEPPKYVGDAPSVPANVSFEIKWTNKDDNIDLRICKEGDCVFGGRKKDRDIGTWDSGKSRNRLFGNDLRTTQEAVRQFDGVIPGTYEMYVHFKDTDTEKNSVRISGLIYTKNENGDERGEAFARIIERSEEPILVGLVELAADGSYKFIKQ
ncbi:MAG: hypothetical protein AAF598_18995 [Bacteroidota bacterium]